MASQQPPGDAGLASLQHRSASFRQITDRFHLTSQANTLLARLPGELGGGAVGLTRRTFSTLASAFLVAVTDLIPLIGALMAIPIAAGIKVLLSERLQARDAADGRGDA